MENNEFMRLEEKCPKCQNAIMLQKSTCSEGALYYVFCECCQCKGHGEFDERRAITSFHKELSRKEKLALRKPEKILTDIRDYLNELLAEWNGADVHFEKISLVEKQLENLTEYAKKLGVELLFLK